jgi:hypothetical protein
MEASAPPAAPAGPPAPPGPGHSRLWYLLLPALVLWQGWMTLSLFGPGDAVARLRGDEPILSGRHPLHLYHGRLGAQALGSLGRLSCFDPNFQAGYPKTPVFDSGSRPAEMFLFLAGDTHSPAAYKLGLAGCWLLVPVLLLLAARLSGLNPAGACLATLLGLAVWWGAPARAALEAGHLDLLLAAPAALAQIALLIYFDRAPCVVSWLGLLVTGYLGWFADPVFFALLLPLNLVFYLSVGARHGVVWHLALLGGLAGAVASNAFWLNDWVSYWWIQLPLRLEPRLLSHRTFRTLWDSSLWGEHADRTLALFLLGAAVVGVWRFNQCRQRSAARLLGLGAVGFLLLAVGGALYDPLGSLETPLLLVPALLFAVLPAVHALAEVFRLASRWAGTRWRAAVLLGGAAVLATAAAHRDVLALAGRCAGATPLVIGLSPERAAIVEALREQTTAEGRILWEDRTGPGTAPRWTALLPVWTGRAFISGLDPDLCIEHAYASFADGVLVGRPVKDWSDVELDDFCRRYNVGWVVCWSPAAAQRFRAWGAAEAVATLQDEGTGCLFRLNRPLSFALKGRAAWRSADCHRITLADVVPENGVVVLSLHYQSGLQAAPGRVQIERELDPYDPIPFVRLRLPEPAARLTLTWEGP